MLGLDGAGKTSLLERIKAANKRDKSSDKSAMADKEKETLLAMTKISPTVGASLDRPSSPMLCFLSWNDEVVHQEVVRMGVKKRLRGTGREAETDQRVHVVGWQYFNCAVWQVRLLPLIAS